MSNQYDVVIVGTGVAGLYASLQFEDDVSVLLVSKRAMELSNSSLAQGGVAAVLDKENDNYNIHMADTLIAGGYTNDVYSLHVLVTEGPDEVLKLKELGADFDIDDSGNLALTLEGGHSRRRIVHHKDSTGKEIVDTLMALIPKHKNIDFMENTMLFDAQNADNGFYIGLMSTSDSHDVKTIKAKYCIFATGGIGRIYEYTTNSSICTGDGIMIAEKLGAKIKGLSLIQFHPTAFASESDRECFLISEAVRGEGAKLLNANHQQFMHLYDKRGELAPRDVVSRSIIQEAKKIDDNHFYLDITHRPADFIKQRFPMIYSRCLEEGVDITKDYIPIFPCHHYLMGGIDVDINAKTKLDRLYACGECSHTGVHGSNRLASNSLLEAIVFSNRAVKQINELLKDEKDEDVKGDFIDWRLDGEELPKGNRTEIREIMQRTYFVTPADCETVMKSLNRINEIRDSLIRGNYKITPAYVETLSLATSAKIVLEEVLDK